MDIKQKKGAMLTVIGQFMLKYNCTAEEAKERYSQEICYMLFDFGLSISEALEMRDCELSTLIEE